LDQAGDKVVVHKTLKAVECESVELYVSVFFWDVGVSRAGVIYFYLVVVGVQDKYMSFVEESDFVLLAFDDERSTFMNDVVINKRVVAKGVFVGVVVFAVYVFDSSEASVVGCPESVLKKGLHGKGEDSAGACYCQFGFPVTDGEAIVWVARDDTGVS
jgi:hypothetical protein